MIATSEPSRKEGWTGGGAHQWRLSQSRSLRGRLFYLAQDRHDVFAAPTMMREPPICNDNAAKADDERPLFNRLVPTRASAAAGHDHPTGVRSAETPAFRTGHEEPIRSTCPLENIVFKVRQMVRLNQLGISDPTRARLHYLRRMIRL
jgi:hypothetical protein